MPVLLLFLSCIFSKITCLSIHFWTLIRVLFFHSFLDKAAIKDSNEVGNQETNKWKLSTLTDVEEVKMVIRMLPIWATTIMFWSVHAQMTTFSVAQASTMQRKIKSFEIPSAAMTGFFVLSTLVTVPIYDRFIMPMVKRVSNNPYGLTPLQRIGVGLTLSVLGMCGAALCEIKRLHVARSKGLVNDPVTTVPVTVFWLLPQFILVGSGEAFIYVGQLDFFLKECPKGMKTMSTGLFLSTLSLGFFFSSVLVSIVHSATGKKPWIADNLNQGRLYDFYWLLAVMSALNFIFFFMCAKWYVYKEKRFAHEGIQMEESIGPIGGH